MSDDVKRWTFEQIRDNHELEPRELIGPWLLASDHEQTIAARDRRIEELEGKPADHNRALAVAHLVKIELLERELAEARKEIEKTYKGWVGRDFMHLPLSEAVGAVRTKDLDDLATARAVNAKLREQRNALIGNTWEEMEFDAELAAIEAGGKVDE